jgi:lysozyme
MTDRILGFDVSSWQDKNETPQQINFDKMKLNGGNFVFIRSILSKMAVDGDFYYNWRESKKAGLLRGSYCFCDYTLRADEVANKFVSILENDKGELPPAMDIEEFAGIPFPPRYNMLLWMEQFSNIIQSKMKVKPIVYISPKYINMLKPIPDWLLTHDLWIAHYLQPFYMSLGNQPTFKPWDKYLIWQWTDREDGLKYGAESLQIDADYFSGSMVELLKYSEKYTGEINIPQYTLEQKVEKLWNAHPELH